MKDRLQFAPQDQRRFTRRQVVKAAQAAVALPILSVMASCARPEVVPTQTRKPEATPTVEPKNPNKDTIVHLIENLPETPIKGYLQRIVVPYFSYPHPRTISYAGVPLEIDDVSVAINLQPRTDKNVAISGTFTMRNSISSREPVYPVKETTIAFPFIGYVLDEERAKVAPKFQLLYDGTLSVPITFPTDKEIFQGLSPEITYTGRDPNLLSPDEKKEYEAYLAFGLLKEACGLLLYHLHMGETLKKIRANL